MVISPDCQSNTADDSPIDLRTQGGLENFSARLRRALGTEPPAIFAKRIGVPKQSVDANLNGAMPSFVRGFAIADALQVEARWLATGEGPERLVQPTEAQVRSVGERMRAAHALVDQAIEAAGVKPGETLRQILLSLMFKHDIPVEDMALLLQATAPEIDS